MIEKKGGVYFFDSVSTIHNKDSNVPITYYDILSTTRFGYIRSVVHT